MVTYMSVLARYILIYGVLCTTTIRIIYNYRGNINVL